jgi:hypothetical protein
VTLASILANRPVASIAGAAALMAAIEEVLPEDDGVRWFNHLYLRVTQAVDAAAQQEKSFRDRAFLDRLDVVFANLYFDALAAGADDPSAAPPAWRPLLAARACASILPVQFALAGMDAHINRDLPAGIVAVFAELGGNPVDDSARHEDFDRVNGILEAVEGQVKSEYATGIVGTIDDVTTPVDDHIAMWSVRAARETAWTNAQVLWTLQPAPALRNDFFDRLDRFTGFAARGLLAPVAARPS